MYRGKLRAVFHITGIDEIEFIHTDTFTDSITSDSSRRQFSVSDGMNEFGVDDVLLEILRDKHDISTLLDRVVEIVGDYHSESFAVHFSDGTDHEFNHWLENPKIYVLRDSEAADIIAAAEGIEVICDDSDF